MLASNDLCAEPVDSEQNDSCAASRSHGDDGIDTCSLVTSINILSISNFPAERASEEAMLTMKTQGLIIHESQYISDAVFSTVPLHRHIMSFL